MPADPLGILLISGNHDRAHYAYVLASGAAAVGRHVVLFATNAGCHAILRDWSGLVDPGRDAIVQAQGVAGLETLRDAARELGVRVIACSAGLRMAGLEGRALADGAEVAGVATFLEAVGDGQMVCL